MAPFCTGLVLRQLLPRGVLDGPRSIAKTNSGSHSPVLSTDLSSVGPSPGLEGHRVLYGPFLDPVPPWSKEGCCNKPEHMNRESRGLPGGGDV